MEFSTQTCGECRVLAVRGRLDAFGSRELQARLSEAMRHPGLILILDMAGVDYLSSAALRVLLGAQQELAAGGGSLRLAGLHPYCREVLEITGLSPWFGVFSDVAEAAAAPAAASPADAGTWEGAETFDLPTGSLRVWPGKRGTGIVEVLGHIEDVLYTRVTRQHLRSRRFSEAEYSIGLGGLGDRVDDYFHLMGEMITVGGTMVWLPTDGNDTPDYLIPRVDSGGVTIRTAFNISFGPDFDEVAYFESREASGTTMDGLYRDLFDLARRRRADFRGALGLACRTEMSAVFGSGVRRSPVVDLAPGDGRMITDPLHFSDWFEIDTEPRHREVTALVTGVGVDLTADLAAYDPQEIGAVFYLNPANRGSQTVLLHNHAVVFSPLGMPERPQNLAAEIRRVVEAGDFADMRHLLDRSSIRRAVLGIGYVQRFQRVEGS